MSWSLSPSLGIQWAASRSEAYSYFYFNVLQTSKPLLIILLFFNFPLTDRSTTSCSITESSCYGSSSQASIMDSSRELDPTLQNIIKNAGNQYGNSSYVQQSTGRPRSSLNQRGFLLNSQRNEYQHSYEPQRNYELRPPIIATPSSLDDFGRPQLPSLTLTPINLSYSNFYSHRCH